MFIFILHFLYKKYQNFLLPIIISFLITLLFVKNIQLLMGFTIQTFHWSRDAAIPFILILSIFYISQIYINKKFITLLLVLFFSLFQHSAYTYSEANWRNHTANTEEVHLYNYLNKSTLDDDVIASPWVMSSSVLNYSKRKVYIPHAPITFANGKEITNRLIDYYCAVGVNSNDFKRILSDKHSYYSVFHMSNAYHPATFSYFLSRDNLNLRGPYFSDSEKDAMLDTLSECKKSVDNDSFMMQYRVDYLIMPDYLKTTKFLLKFKFESIDGFRIYNLNKKIT